MKIARKGKRRKWLMASRNFQSRQKVRRRRPRQMRLRRQIPRLARWYRIPPRSRILARRGRACQRFEFLIRPLTLREAISRRVGGKKGGHTLWRTKSTTNIIVAGILLEFPERW